MPLHAGGKTKGHNKDRKSGLCHSSLYQLSATDIMNLNTV